MQEPELSLLVWTEAINVITRAELMTSFTGDPVISLYRISQNNPPDGEVDVMSQYPE